MFIAALSAIAKIGKQPRCPSIDKRIQKGWYIYTMQASSAIKKEQSTDAWFNVDKGMDLETG